MDKFTGKYVALLIAATLSVVALGFNAHAGEAVGATTRAVAYADLNLDTVAGAKVLYKRIEKAAEAVCGDVGSRQLEQAAAAKACVDHAVASSVRAVNRAQLTRVANLNGHGTTIKVAAIR
jgi:UrcA family protein